MPRDFGRDVERRVRAILADRPRPRLVHRWWVRAVLVLVVEWGTIVVLLFADLSPAAAGALAILLGLAIGAVGLNVSHERLHGRPLDRRDPSHWMVALLAWPTGVGRAWWRAEHNVSHHGGVPGTGRAGQGPVSFGSFARLAPEQARRPWHAVQHVYFPAAYPFAVIALFVRGVAFAVSGRVAGHRVASAAPGPIVVRLVDVAAVPAALLTLALLRHSGTSVLAVTALAFGVAGTAVSLALAVEIVHRGTAVVPAASGRDAWSAWQVDVAMTIDTNPVVEWYLAHLNCHTAHHLFPRAPMHRLPEVGAAIGSACAEHGVPFHHYPTYRSSWREVHRFLRELGRADDAFVRPRDGRPLEGAAPAG